MLKVIRYLLTIICIAIVGFGYGQTTASKAKKTVVKKRAAGTRPSAASRSKAKNSAPVVLANGFKRLPNGIQYRIVTPNAGEKIKLSDVVTCQVIQRTPKDSVMFSSYQQGQPVKLQVQPSQNAGDLMDVMKLLSVNDSVLIRVPVDSIFKGHEAQRPPFMAKGSFVHYNLKIQRVQTIADAIAERNVAINKIKATEAAIGDAYIKANNLTVTTTATGLKYVIKTTGTKPKPQPGDSVYVSYVGRTAAGKVFDTSIQSEAKAAGIEQPGRPYEPIKFVVGQRRVIAGWDEGLLLLNEGSKAVFIIPADLGYGEQGSGNDIKPFNTLVFDVELVKVIPAKPASAGSAEPKP